MHRVVIVGGARRVVLLVLLSHLLVVRLLVAVVHPVAVGGLGAHHLLVIELGRAAMQAVLLRIFLPSPERRIKAFAIILLEMLLQRVEIVGRLSEYFDVHFLFLDLNQHVQLAKDGLDGFVTALVILQKLLHVPKRVAQL